ncbi:MAG: hypothetical protein VX913_09660 [Planctomycetota bacterium]|nr:hypothetical protein [Planctomycetota bacterium]
MLTATLVAVVSLVLVQDEIANPEYGRWASFGTGSEVVMRTVDASHDMEMRSTTTLQSKGDKEIALEVEISLVVAGTSVDLPARTRKLPATIKRAFVGGAVEPPETGEETLGIAQHDLRCTWALAVIDSGECTIRSEVWTCPQVPGGLVQMASESTGAITMKVKQHLVSFVAQ